MVSVEEKETMQGQRLLFVIDTLPGISIHVNALTILLFFITIVRVKIPLGSLAFNIGVV